MGGAFRHGSAQRKPKPDARKSDAPPRDLDRDRRMPDPRPFWKAAKIDNMRLQHLAVLTSFSYLP
ncbi:hypothetical protein JKG47_19250 [Acidithiobacillus sp. MC6.1]|nr:hypothetical protein [Acidithiobacillus sp. MC6.1]